MDGCGVRGMLEALLLSRLCRAVCAGWSLSQKGTRKVKRGGDGHRFLEGECRFEEEMK